MKTNVSIELSDEQRSILADLVDGKTSARKIKRAEVVAICRQHIGGLVGVANPVPEDGFQPPLRSSGTADLYRVDPKDRALMARPDDPGYVRGWNLVKRGSHG